MRHTPSRKTYLLVEFGPGVGSMAFSRVSNTMCEKLSMRVILISTVANIFRRHLRRLRFQVRPRLGASDATTTSNEIARILSYSHMVLESRLRSVVASISAICRTR